MRWSETVAVAVLASTLACGGSSPGADGGADAGGGPSPAGTCSPNPGSKGNAQNVGAYCTVGGGQCAGYGNGGLGCAIDLDPRGGNFCIQIGCATNADCGAEACCTGDPGSVFKACVPLLCVSTDGTTCPPVPSSGADGGLDAGMDAGSAADAGEDAGMVADAGSDAGMDAGAAGVDGGAPDA